MNCVARYAIGLALQLAGIARADAPHPASLSSPAMETAAVLTQWLTDGPDGLRGRLIASDATAFDVTRSRPMALGELAGRFPQARVLTVLTYEGRPATLASDLSQQLKQIDDVPSNELAPLILTTDKPQRADEIAGEWVADVLRLTDRDPNGVIVLLHSDPVETASLTDAPPQRRLVMIVFKLGRSDRGNTLSVRRLAYVLPAEPASSR